MLERIRNLPDTFIVAYDESQRPLGYVVGPASNQRFISDDLFESTHPNDVNAPYQTILSLVVAPDAQKRGIAGELLDRLTTVAKQQGRKLVTLTCLERLVPYYRKHGYEVDGVSDSQHAGENWYNMTRLL